MKKVLSLALCLVLALSMFAIVPMTASAAEAEFSPTGATSGKTGDCTWSLNGTVLTISGKGRMGTYGASFGGAPWGTAITKLVINNGVTNISQFGFYGCKKLSSVDIPGTVTDIGMAAFISCESLKSFTIPDTVKTIGASAFSGCSGLESITVGSSVTSNLSHAFNYCPSIKSITVSKNNKVFDSRDNCNAIIETKTNSLVFGCKNTVIPNSVTSIAWGAFSGCTGLTSVTIPDSVTEIGDEAFYRCTSLTGVTIPDSVTNIGYGAFYGCTSLTGVTIPDSVTEIVDEAFGYYDDEETHESSKVDNFTIYGHPGTEAERYAADNGFTFISSDEKPSDMILGDADNDGQVTIMDATAIQRNLADLSTESYNEAAADADQDDMVTIMDATAIQRHLAELPTNENIGKPI